ncbi:MAG: hypothetical protein R3C53_07130 [Pirellulaceae bacterium]
MEANLTTAAASAIQTSQIRNEAAATIAAKTLKVQKAQGEAAVDLIKQVEQLSDQLANGHVDVKL